MLDFASSNVTYCSWKKANYGCGVCEIVFMNEVEFQNHMNDMKVKEEYDYENENDIEFQKYINLMEVNNQIMTFIMNTLSQTLLLF